jgi:hypothetical protein
MKNRIIDQYDSAVQAEIIPRKIAYADPPYIGQAKRRYQDDLNCAEVNHKLLVRHLTDNYDGRALPCSTPSLRTLLPLRSPDVRVGAWVKPFAAFKRSNPACVWEPVLFKPCRSRKGRFTVRDYVDAHITLQKGVCGVKPDRFCYWLFETLAMLPEDTFDDLFPGSGAVSRAWERWRAKELERRVTSEPYGLYIQAKSPAEKVVPCHDRPRGPTLRAVCTARRCFSIGVTGLTRRKNSHHN